jgi:hypothetical protein
MKPQLQQYFKGEVAQSSINLRLMEAVVQATFDWAAVCTVR